MELEIVLREQHLVVLRKIVLEQHLILQIVVAVAIGVLIPKNIRV